MIEHAKKLIGNTIPMFELKTTVYIEDRLQTNPSTTITLYGVYKNVHR